MKITSKIAFIGSGFMAGAMMDGIIKSGTSDAGNIIVINDAFPESADEAVRKYGVVKGSPADIEKCEIVVFGVKPQVFSEAVEMYGEFFTDGKLYISIMAGISNERLMSALGSVRTIRCMPNLALSVGASATVYAPGELATEADCDVTEAIFASMGKILRVEESMISAVTALSGSGPAYFCRLTEAMISAAVEYGMDAVTAKELAVQTLIGTAKIISDTDVAPDVLRVRVTSKKGTTEAALNAMTDTGFDGSVKAAFEAARLRSDELGK